jgi:diguanylate cyclase (GGDEF)-like protein
VANMLEHNISSILNYLKNGFYSSNNYEITLKIYLIYIFSMIALSIFLIMGINCVLDNYILLADILFCGAGLLIFNIIYLKLTDNDIISAYIILYFLFMLMFYLIYSGGVNNTGPLWTFILPPVVLFIHGLKKGLIELLIFLLITMGMFFIQNGTLLQTSYTYEFKIRLVLILFVVIMLSSLYQYTREISMKRMQKMQKDLEFFLRRDPLTGLYNRRGYDYNIPNIKKASYGAILMCDIDHFKKINDSYGHDAGDCVIQAIAKIIRENIRMQDLSVRWGGEEFFIFLPEVTLDEAYLISEKLRKNIEHTSIHYHDVLIDVTMSIGISIVEKDILLSEAIKNADSAMYLSKSRGRNQTTKL